MMRIAVKIGTNILSHADGTLNSGSIKDIVDGIVQWHQAGWQVVIVSSGAIGAGMGLLALKERPRTVRDKQAAAAVGQVRLMEVYGSCFNRHNIRIAQVLLTRDDLMSHKRYLNTRNTLMTLIDMRVIPIINENDTVSVDEIVFGDNDTLSAIVAMKVEAETLLILTDVEGLYSCDPRKTKGAPCINVIEKITPEIERMCSSRTGSIASIGGMQTKIRAAKIATRVGIKVIIANGKNPGIFDAILKGKPVGTTCIPQQNKLKSRKQWIAFGAGIKGSIMIDEGAVEAILKRGKSLLPAGVTGVEGYFSSGDMISLVDQHHLEIGRGITSFSSEEIKKIKGEKTTRIKEILKDAGETEIVHRDNLVIL